MARINIEDSLWKDNRFQDLMIKVGSRHAAKGMVLELYVEAQKFWINSGGKGIPRPAWDKSGLPSLLIECGLAEDRGDYIYAIGSKEQFAWLEQRSEAGRKNKGKSNERRQTESNGKQRKASKRVPPSLTPSPSLTLFSSSDSKNNSVGGGADALSPDQIRNPIGYFISSYVRYYQMRYPDGRPDLTGPVQGRIKGYLKDVPIERAVNMIRTYCEMNDGWFLTKGHDFETFMQNLTKVGLKLDTGKTISRTQAQNAEKADYHKDQLERIASGEL